MAYGFHIHSKEYTADVRGFSFVVERDGDLYKAYKSGKGLTFEDDDASTVIQGAVDQGGRILVLNDEYMISSQVRVKSGVELDMSLSKIIPSSDFDVFYMERGGKLRNVVFDLTQVSTFNSSCILLHGEQKMGVEYNTQISNVFIMSDGKGTGIHILCEENNQWVAFARVNNIMTKYLEYAIKFTLLGSGASCYANGNIFSNIRDTNSKYVIYMSGNAGTKSHKNIFDDVTVQASQAEVVVRLRDQSNIVLGLRIFDLPSTSTAIEFESDAIRNIVIGSFPYEQISYPSITEQYQNFIISSWHAYAEEGGVRVLGRFQQKFPSGIIEFADADNKNARWLKTYISGDSYPRLTFDYLGQMYLGDGASAQNLVLENVDGKLRVKNTRSIQIPYTESLPASGDFVGDIRLYYDGTYYYIAVWNGSAWVKVQLS